MKAEPFAARRLPRKLGAAAALARVQALLVTRYPVHFAASLLGSFGGVLALAWGLKMFSLPGMGLRSAAILFYGYLLFIFLSDSLWRIGPSLWEEQAQGTLMNLYVTPAPRFALLAARSAPLLGVSLLGAVLACLAVDLLFGRLPAENLWLAALIFIFSVAGMAGMGFLFACYHLLVGEAAGSTGNVIEFGTLFACAMFFPFARPAWAGAGRLAPAPAQLLCGCLPLGAAWFPTGFP